MTEKPPRPVWSARLQREREQRKWTKPRMARELQHAKGYEHQPTESLVRQILGWEKGEHFPRDWTDAYAAAFGTTVEELFGDQTFGGRDVPAFGAITGMETFLPGHAHAVPSKPPAVSAIVTGITAALFDDTDVDRPHVALPVLDRRTLRAWELRQSTEYAELGDLLSVLLTDVRDTYILAGSEGQQTYTAPTYVHAHNAASSLLKRLHVPELAAIAADRALQAAWLTGDEALTGAAVLRIANVFLSAGRYREAADTAVNGADNLIAHLHASPEVAATWGALLLTAALAAAALPGEEIQAWELLGQAKVAAAILGQEYAGLHAVFGPTNLAIHAVQVATELGNSREALRRGEHVDPDTLPPVLLERRSTLLIDLARCHLGQGDHAEALGALLDADRVAPQEVRYHQATSGLTAALLRTRSGSNPDLRALADRIAIPA